MYGKVIKYTNSLGSVITYMEEFFFFFFFEMSAYTQKEMNIKTMAQPTIPEKSFHPLTWGIFSLP